MSRKVTKVTLSDGVEYQIIAFGALQGYATGRKISSIIVTPITKFLEARDNTEGEKPITLSDCASALVNNIEKADSLGIVKELISSVSVQGQDLDFDNYFSANYGVLIDLITEVVKFNYESVFTASVIQGRNPLQEAPIEV